MAFFTFNIEFFVASTTKFLDALAKNMDGILIANAFLFAFLLLVAMSLIAFNVQLFTGSAVLLLFTLAVDSNGILFAFALLFATILVTIFGILIRARLALDLQLLMVAAIEFLNAFLVQADKVGFANALLLAGRTLLRVTGFTFWAINV